VELWGSGRPRREFLHSDDLAEACLFVMDYPDPGRLGHFVNVGTGQDLTIRELAELVGEIVGFRGELTFDATRPDGTPRKVLDVSRLESLGWRPRIPLREGIERTYRWFVEHGDAAARGSPPA
jgi:GDP-L-fucose synthase